MNRATLWFSVGVHDWTAERAILASNAIFIYILSSIAEEQHYHPSTHDLQGHFQSEDRGPPDPVYFVDRSFVCVSQFPF